LYETKSTRRGSELARKEKEELKDSLSAQKKKLTWGRSKGLAICVEEAWLLSPTPIPPIERNAHGM
jgi:hypothetical protein